MLIPGPLIGTALALLFATPQAGAFTDLKNATYDCAAYHAAVDDLDSCPGEFWGEPFRLVNGELTVSRPTVAHAFLGPHKNFTGGVQVAVVATDGGGMGACVFAYVFRNGTCADAYQLGERSRIDSLGVSGDRAVVGYRRRSFDDPSSNPSSAATLEVPLWK